MNQIQSLVHCITLGKPYECISQIPKNNVGIVRNIDKHTISGNINLYYKHILETVTNLFKSNKIEYILISDNNSKTDLKNDLVASGIPENKIHLNHPGIKTLDGLIAFKQMFGLQKITLIS